MDLTHTASATYGNKSEIVLAANRLFLQKRNQVKRHKGMRQHFSEKQWPLCSKQKGLTLISFSMELLKGYCCCCCWVASVVSDSVRPHRWQPIRLPRPWDSPGKNTGVGCHFPLQCMKVKSESEVSLSCPTLSNPMDCSLPGPSIHGIFQARVLEWSAIAKCGLLSRLFLSLTPAYYKRKTKIETSTTILPQGESTELFFFFFLKFWLQISSFYFTTR